MKIHITALLCALVLPIQANHIKKTIIKKNMKKTDLIEIKAINPTIKADIRYATKNNFTGKVLYNLPKAIARRGTAEKLDAVQKALAQQGLGLKIWDAYRPLSVQKKLWEVYPDPKMVADPKKGSIHNRGCAIDLTLISLKTGRELAMPTPFDEFSERAHPDYIKGISKKAIANRTLLRTVMEKHGFTAHKNEWWHFNDTDAAKYDLMDVPFEKLGS